MKLPNRASHFAVAAGGAFLAVVSFGAAPKPAQAQGVFDMGVLTNTLSQGASSSAGRGNKGERGSAHHKSGGPSYDARVTTRAAFTPSPVVRKRNVAAFIGNIRKNNPQAAALLEKEFARKDMFGEIAKELSKVGLKTDSVTDAFTVYMVTAWQGVRGQNGDINPAYIKGVRDQMSHVLANIPAVTSASDAKKQELAESFILQSILIDSTVAGAKKQPALMPKVKASLLASTQATVGYDLTKFKLSEKGLSL